MTETVCLSCIEGTPKGECPKSERPCGHHCDCSWVHHYCHWCCEEMVPVDDRGPDERRADEEAEDAERRLDAEKAGDL